MVSFMMSDWFRTCAHSVVLLVHNHVYFTCNAWLCWLTMPCMCMHVIPPCICMEQSKQVLPIFTAKAAEPLRVRASSTQPSTCRFHLRYVLG
jgi:hypothetical protein